LNRPAGLAFDSAGDLFEADSGSGNIYEFTNGVATEMGTFASGLSPIALAFDSSGNLFQADSRGNIYEFTHSEMRSTVATGLSGPARTWFLQRSGTRTCLHLLS
jgi:DNA-binding beta-propeller fold protein YncE